MNKEEAQVKDNTGKTQEERVSRRLDKQEGGGLEAMSKYNARRHGEMREKMNKNEATRGKGESFSIVRLGVNVARRMLQS